MADSSSPTSPAPTIVSYGGANSQGQQTGTDASGTSYTRVESGVGTANYSSSWVPTDTLNNSNQNSTEGTPSSTVGIVTSNQSQTAYNNNVKTLNDTKTSLTNSLNSNSSSNNTNQNNINTPPVTSPSNNQNNNGNNNSGANGSGTNSSGSGSSGSDSSGSGSGDGSTTVTDSQGNSYTIPPGTDMGIVNSTLANYNNAVNEVQGYQNQIAALNNYDVNTDPDAVAAVQSIEDSYDVLIQQMTNKNAILMGSINENSARSGSLQYGNEMDSMYKNAEFDAATQRIATLKQQENDAITKSNQAYEAGNVKDLNQATTDLKNAQSQALTALQDLQKTINDQVAANTAQAKQDAADAKAQAAADVTNSKAAAQQVLNNLTAKGLTDPTSDAYINVIKEAAAADGISDWTKLQAQIGQLTPTAGTAALKNENTASTIQKRNADETIAQQKLAISQAKTSSAASTKANTALSNDIKAQIKSLNGQSTTKQTWAGAYNTIKETYPNAITTLPDGTKVGITQPLSPAQITAAGGDPSIDQNILDILLNKGDNGTK